MQLGVCPWVCHHHQTVPGLVCWAQEPVLQGSVLSYPAPAGEHAQTRPGKHTHAHQSQTTGNKDKEEILEAGEQAMSFRGNQDYSELS